MMMSCQKYPHPRNLAGSKLTQDLVDRSVDIEVEHDRVFMTVHKVCTTLVGFCITGEMIQTEVDHILTVRVLRIVHPTDHVAGLSTGESKRIVDIVQEQISLHDQTIIQNALLSFEESQIVDRIFLPVRIHRAEEFRIRRIWAVILGQLLDLVLLALLVDFSDDLLLDTVQIFLVLLGAFSIGHTLTICGERSGKSRICSSHTSIALGVDVVGRDHECDRTNSKSTSRQIIAEDLHNRIAIQNHHIVLVHLFGVIDFGVIAQIHLLADAVLKNLLILIERIQMVLQTKRGSRCEDHGSDIGSDGHTSQDLRRICVDLGSDSMECSLQCHFCFLSRFSTKLLRVSNDQLRSSCLMNMSSTPDFRTIRIPSRPH
nr:MAG TPA: hypothetical protein [Caudoviricetes sp.]